MTCEEDGTLLILRLEDDSIHRTVVLDQSLPRAVAVSPDGRTAFTANAGSASVSGVDVMMGVVLRQLELGGRPEGSGPLGIAAVSYAAGPAILAVLEPDLRRRVDFVVAIGGYFDTLSVVTYFTTGFHRMPGGPWQQAVPNAYGKWVFVLANAERLDSPFDRVALTAMARRKLADLDADVADLDAGLGAEGRAVADLLANREPERVPGLVASLPPAIRADLAALSLAGRDFTGVAARFILVHGRDDAIVPWSESEALATALPPAQIRPALLGSLAHADLSPAGWLDLIRLWRAVYALMRERR